MFTLFDKSEGSFLVIQACPKHTFHLHHESVSLEEVSTLSIRDMFPSPWKRSRNSTCKNSSLSAFFAPLRGTKASVPSAHRLAVWYKQLPKKIQAFGI